MRKYRFFPLVTSYAKCYKPKNSAVQLHTLRHPHTHHTLTQSHSTKHGHDTTPAPTQPHPLKISRAARKLLPGFWLQLHTVTSTALWPRALGKAVTPGTPSPPRPRAQSEAHGRRKPDHSCLSRGGVPAAPPAKTPRNATSETLHAGDPQPGPQTRAAACARYVPEHRCSQKDPRPDPTSGQSSACVSCAGDRGDGRRRQGG